MKNNRIYLLIAVVVSTLLFSACGGLGKMEKHIAELGASATPNPLEVHGDSVAISISGKFPEKYFGKKVVAEATPVLTYDGGEKAFKMKGFQGESAAGNYEVIPYKTGKSFSYTDQIAYKPEMETSKLELRIHGSQGSKTADFPAIPVADGIITTPYLMKNDDKAIYAKDKFVRTTSKSTSATLNFDYNSSTIKPAELKQEDIALLDTFFTKVAANPRLVVKSIEFKAYCSPEGEILLNDDLAGDRSKAGQKALTDMLKKKKMDAQYTPMMKLTPMGEDWEGFRTEMEKSNIEDRDIIIRILQKTSDVQAREQEIKNISKTYVEIQKDIFPSLRRCYIVINYDEEGYSDAELSSLASSNPGALNYEELLKAATLTENLQEKVNIYKAAEGKAAGDYRASNNLGVAYYMQNKVADAQAQWDKAYTSKKTAETSNNLGIATRLNGDRAKANTLFTESGTPESKYNKGLINIQNGDYASAVSNMSGNKTFNTALAKLLNKDAAGAKTDIDGSNDTSAMADYLRAIIAAHNNDAAAVGTNLKSAAQKDSNLKAKAQKDLEFRNFKAEVSF